MAYKDPSGNQSLSAALKSQEERDKTHEENAKTYENRVNQLLADGYEKDDPLITELEDGAKRERSRIGVTGTQLVIEDVRSVAVPLAAGQVIGSVASRLAGRGTKAIDEAVKGAGPLGGGGAKLENLTTQEIARIQNAANRTGTPISVVGSRANGTARATSDWNYVVPEATSSRTVHSLRSSLPEGPRGLGEPRKSGLLQVNG